MKNDCLLNRDSVLLKGQLSIRDNFDKNDTLLYLHTESNIDRQIPLTIISSGLPDKGEMYMSIGSSGSGINKQILLGYKEPGTGILSLRGHDSHIISFTSTNTTINGDLTVNRTLNGQDVGDFALKTDIKEIPTDLVSETTLTNTLNNYRTINDIKYRISKKCEFKSDGVVLTTEPLEGYHIVGDCELLNIHFDKVFKAEKMGNNQGCDFNLMFLENNSRNDPLY